MPSVYEIVTDKIVAMLEEGVTPWRKPWKGSDGAPCNLVSGKRYQGVNALLLGMAGFFDGHLSPYWMTYKQAKQKGGNVRKGEKGALVLFFKLLEKDDPNRKPDEKPRFIPLARYYTVFNLDQTEGIDAPEVKDLPIFSPIETAEKIVEDMPNKPELVHGGGRACYDPKKDIVTLPKPETFISREEYYSTAFHELTHSTGHKSRLDRKFDKVAALGSDDYSKEELIAEMGAGFLCAEAGIENATLENSASYIQNWINALKADSRLIVQAGSKAQKASNYILGKGEK